MGTSIITTIIEYLDKDAFLISTHTRSKMFEKNITTDELIEIIKNDDVIEEYVDDFPCPSYLILGYFKTNPFHIVIGLCPEEIRIITIYEPDPLKWIDYKLRKD